MTLPEHILRILEHAVMAPSGDNSQPWRFLLDGDSIHVYNIPGRDNPYLNYDQSGSHVAHGALLENLSIAAAEMGFDSRITLFPDPQCEDLVATVSMQRESKIVAESELFACISRRTTNRRPYRAGRLTAVHKEYLRAAVHEIGFCDLFLIEDESRRDLAARGGSAAEIVILENEMLHEFLFRDVVWSSKDEQNRKSGLYVHTMEFNAVQRLLFWLAKYPTFMKFATFAGLTRIIASEDAKLYATGSAMGLVTVPALSREAFVYSGRLMQRIWLKATRLGLALQPITATIFLGLRVRASDLKALSHHHRDIVTQAYADICNAFRINGQIPVIMFRIGHAANPSARCSRIAIEEKTKVLTHGLTAKS